MAFAIFVSAPLAAIVASIIGALWYSPVLFGNFWLKESGMTSSKMTEAKKSGMGKLYFFNLLATYVTALVLAYLIFEYTFIARDALLLAGSIWLGFVAPIAVGQILWERRSVTYFLINIGYQLVSIMSMAAIIVLLS